MQSGDSATSYSFGRLRITSGTKELIGGLLGKECRTKNIEDFCHDNVVRPLDSEGYKRSVVYHAARLSMLHNRMLKRFEKVDKAAEKVEAEVELFDEAVRTLYEWAAC
ncbi:hypothetical protein [Mesorhizobium sp. LSHC412B00]|uniref:hypothetical protein n=1 Tax=Mesorhizobium sp. LSHC412B00 TaxID=1287285 RepID=UPI0003CEDED8|nr:hypothetical protein [Mesorhizobium sp. LSHC412B00]ESX84328.1 hypothetical protein X756_26085 [Mesorhizobium sp. LSHC412B00]